MKMFFFLEDHPPIEIMDFVDLVSYKMNAFHLKKNLLIFSDQGPICLIHKYLSKCYYSFCSFEFKQNFNRYHVAESVLVW